MDLSYSFVTQESKGQYYVVRYAAYHWKGSLCCFPCVSLLSVSYVIHAILLRNLSAKGNMAWPTIRCKWRWKLPALLHTLKSFISGLVSLGHKTGSVSQVDVDYATSLNFLLKKNLIGKMKSSINIIVPCGTSFDNPNNGWRHWGEWWCFPTHTNHNHHPGPYYPQQAFRFFFAKHSSMSSTCVSIKLT